MAEAKKSGFLEAGEIVNTHGVRGEVKILPWADSPEFLTGFDRLYIDNKPVKVLSARVHKNCVIVLFDGVSGIDGAIELKHKIVAVDRTEVQPPDGRHFVADLIGLKALAESGEELGVVQEVLSLPAGNVYVIIGAREILVPAVPEFVLETDVDSGYIKFRLIEGM